MKLNEYLVSKCITQADFAKKVTKINPKNPVTQSAISQWLKKGVPKHRALDVERATNRLVKRFESRPDIYPPEDYAA